MQVHKVLIILMVLITTIFIGTFAVGRRRSETIPDSTWWEIQSVDTVKYSRDIAREMADDSGFDTVIDTQVAQIAAIGATHVSLGTPYDSEFIPFLKRWVDAARRHKLKVWFRGNLSGWEGWFGYHKISAEDRLVEIDSFIVQNPGLFEDGDLFSSCSECENGNLGDPRHTGKVNEYRNFLVKEYSISREAFKKINKNVYANFYSMNGDVARLVMDRETTKRLGGIVVIDHYVNDPQTLRQDIDEIAKQSGGKVVLGEFGAPIPDIHGTFNTDEQAIWIEETLSEVSKSANLVGVNYWTGHGGSTQLWDDGNATEAVIVVNKFYAPLQFKGVIKNRIGRPIANAIISSSERTTSSGADGHFSLPYHKDDLIVTITAPGYQERIYLAEENEDLVIFLDKSNENVMFGAFKFIYNGINRWHTDP